MFGQIFDLDNNNVAKYYPCSGVTDFIPALQLR
jgi:hypothetical protein